MIDYKTPEEIEIMRQGGRILAQVLFEVLDNVRPGVSEKDIDLLADRLISEKGAEAGFKKVKGYSHATCISTNDVVVHGIPSNYKFKEGDVVGIDCGVFYKGFNTDMSETRRVSNQKSHLRQGSRFAARRVGGQAKIKNQKYDDVDRFLDTGKKALNEAIKVAVVGNRIGHISKTIQEIVEGQGYSIVRSLIGHGVGKKLHEEPEVPGFLNKKIEKTPMLKEGMTIAIEVIYNMRSHEVSYSNRDGWTITTSDGSMSGLFERTIAITKDGSIVLTV